MLFKKDFVLRIKGIMLLTLFVVYFTGTTFFPHTHIINGITVVHSHPYSATEHHTHSASSVQLIQLLSSLIFSVSLAVFLAKTLWILLSDGVSKKYTENYFNSAELVHFNRPPPCFL